MMTLTKKKQKNAGTIAVMIEAVKLAEANLLKVNQPLTSADAAVAAVTAKLEEIRKAKGDETECLKELEAAKLIVSNLLADTAFSAEVGKALAAVEYRKADLAKQQAFIIRKAVR